MAEASFIAYNTHMALHAIITAGGLVPRDLAEHAPVRRKALIPLHGITLLDTACRAARESKVVDKAVAVGNDDVQHALDPVTDFVREGADLIDNIQRAFDRLGGDKHDYLVLSPDLPFVTGQALDAFLTLAASQCELAAPVVSRTDFLRAFPGAPNKFLQLARGEQVTMGSCFYFAGPTLRANFPLARDCYRYRRYPHRLAILLGLPIVLALLFRRLTLEMIERRASQLTGAVVRGLQIAEGGLAYDIDSLANYEFALDLLRARQPTSDQ